MRTCSGTGFAEQALEKAAKQVRTRKYAKELENAGGTPVHEYAMVFDGTRAWVERIDEELSKD